jgi:hypothetical protein
VIASKEARALVDGVPRSAEERKNEQRCIILDQLLFLWQKEEFTVRRETIVFDTAYLREAIVDSLIGLRRSERRTQAMMQMETEMSVSRII